MMNEFGCYDPYYDLTEAGEFKRSGGRIATNHNLVIIVPIDFFTVEKKLFHMVASVRFDEEHYTGLVQSVNNYFKNKVLVLCGGTN